MDQSLLATARAWALCLGGPAFADPTGATQLRPSHPVAVTRACDPQAPRGWPPMEFAYGRCRRPTGTLEAEPHAILAFQLPPRDAQDLGPDAAAVVVAQQYQFSEEGARLRGLTFLVGGRRHGLLLDGEREAAIGLTYPALAAILGRRCPVSDAAALPLLPLRDLALFAEALRLPPGWQEPIALRDSQQAPPNPSLLLRCIQATEPKTRLGLWALGPK